MKPSAVLALGGIAQKICKERGINFEPFYHPQYWKRFKSKYPYALVERLKELM
jgi:uracil-DNA glycosylase